MRSISCEKLVGKENQMKKRPLLNLNLITIFVMASLLLGVSCTKERPPKMNQAQERELMPISLFRDSEIFKLKLISNPANGTNRAKIDVEKSDIPKPLKKIFDNLVIDSHGLDEIDFVFRLREDKKIIGYKLLPKTKESEISVFEKMISEVFFDLSFKYSNKIAIPIFYYETSFVKLVVRKDYKGEDTTEYDTFETKISDASFVRLNLESDIKNIVRNSFEENKEIILLKEDMDLKKINATVEDFKIIGSDAPRELQFLFENIKISSNKKEKHNVELFIETVVIDEQHQYLAVNRYLTKDEESLLTPTEVSRLQRGLSSSDRLKLTLFKYPIAISNLKKRLDDKNFPTFSLDVISDPTQGRYIVMKSNEAQRLFFDEKEDDKNILPISQLSDVEIIVDISCDEKNNLVTYGADNNIRCKVSIDGGMAELTSPIKNLFEELYLDRVFLFNSNEPELKSKKLRLFVDFLSNGNVRFSRLISNDEKRYLPAELTSHLIISPTVKNNQEMVELFRSGISYKKRVNQINENGKETGNIFHEETTKDHADIVSFDSFKNRSIAEYVKRDPYLIDKSLINEESNFLYVASMHEVPSEAVQMLIGYFQGNPEIVRFKMSENSLDIYHLSKTQVEGRFFNILDKVLGKDDALIASIPIQHVDYVNIKDSFGHETNREIRDSETHWKKRRFIIPQYQSINTWNLNSAKMSAGISDYCHNLVKKEITPNLVVKNGELGFEVREFYSLKETNYCLGIGRAMSFIDVADALSNSTFSITQFHSFKKYDEIATPNYQPVPYPIFDQKKFGFFAVKNSTYNQNLENDYKKEQFFLERWSPERKEIKYHLTSNFQKPENQIFKELTKKSIEIVNQGLEEAQIKFKIVLDENESNDLPGDLNKNTIVLIDNALSNGRLLGYCPAVADPLTGEIVQSHIVMYGSTMWQVPRGIYESIVNDENNRLRFMNDKLSSVISPENNDKEALKNGKKNSYDKYNYREKLGNLLSDLEIDQDGNPIASLELQDLANKLKDPMIFIDQQSRVTEDKFWEVMKGSKSSGEKIAKVLAEFGIEDGKKIFEELKQRENKIAEHYSTVNELALDLTTSERIAPILAIPEVCKRKNLENKCLEYKTWMELSAETKSQINEGVISALYVSTFIHEFGHGLGLRHNFKSNFDHKHFYNENELRQHNVTMTPHYSSVMSYGYTFFDELPIFGKYDIAALKFGYNRKIEVVKGLAVEERELSTTLEDFIKKIQKDPFSPSNEDESTGGKISIIDQIGKMELLKEYLYCTDEDIEHDIFCNRHVVGKDIVEMVDFTTKVYKRNLRNYYRDGRSRFKSSLESNINRLRRVYENMERLKKIGTFSEYADLFSLFFCKKEYGNKFQFYCDQFRISEKARRDVHRFFLEELSMPDHTCLYKKVTEKNRNFEITDLERIDEESLNTHEIIQMPLDRLYGEYLNMGGADQVESFPKSCFDSRIELRLQNLIKKEKMVKKKSDASALEEDDFIEVKVLGEYGRVQEDIEIPDNLKKYDYNELMVKGAWESKLMAAFFASMPNWSFISMVRSYGKMFNNSNITESFYFKEFLDSIFLGKSSEHLPIYIGLRNGPKIESDLAVEHGVIFDANQEKTVFATRGLKVDINKEIIKTISSTLKSFEAFDDSGIARDLWLQLEVGSSELYEGELSLSQDEWRSVETKEKTKKYYHANKVNHYGYEILRKMSYAYDAMDFFEKFPKGERINDVDRIRRDRLIYGIKKKYLPLRTINNIFDYKSNICNSLDIHGNKSLSPQGDLNIGKIWDIVLSDRSGEGISDTEKVNLFRSYLKGIQKLNGITGEIPFEIANRWQAFFSYIHSNHCSERDYRLIESILETSRIVKDKLGNVLNATEYAHATGVHRINIHSQYLGADFLNQIYQETIKDGSDFYAIKTTEIPALNSSINKIGHYLSLTKKIIEMTADPLIIDEDKKVEQLLDEIWDYKDISEKRIIDIESFLRGEMNIVITEQEVAKYARYTRILNSSLDLKESDVLEMRELHRKMGVAVKKKRVALNHKAIAIIEGKGSLTEDQIKTINDYRRMEAELSMSWPDHDHYKKYQEEKVDMLSEVRRTLLKGKILSLLEDGDKQQLIAEYKSEIELEKEKLKSSSGGAREIKTKEIILSKLMSNSHVEKELYYNLGQLITGLYPEQIKVEAGLAEEYERLKDRNILDLLLIDKEGSLKSSDMKEKVKLMWDDFSTYDAAFGNSESYQKLIQKFDYLIKVPMKVR